MSAAQRIPMIGPATETRILCAFAEACVITAEAAAALIGCDVKTLREMTDAGIIRAVRKGAGKTRDGKPRILRGNAMCIASECMAWRPVFEDRGLGSRVGAGGYCGLAGPVPVA